MRSEEHDETAHRHREEASTRKQEVHQAVRPFRLVLTRSHSLHGQSEERPPRLGRVHHGCQLSSST